MYTQHRHLGPYLRQGNVSARLEDGLLPIGAEKRREHRYPVNETGIVYAVAPLKRDRVAVRVIDMSRNGLKLQVATPIDPGTEIQVMLQDLFVLGEVRYCRGADGCFHLGMLVKDVLQAVRQDVKRGIHLTC
jgi:hypothetical protein